MSKQTERLSDLAREALEQYTREISAGGEPVYPDWANDLKAALAEREQLVTALTVCLKRLVADCADKSCAEIMEARAALTAAGVA